MSFQAYSQPSQFSTSQQSPGALPLEKKAVGSPVASPQRLSSYTPSRTISPGMLIPCVNEQQWLYQNQQQEATSPTGNGRQLTSSRCTYTRSASCNFSPSSPNRTSSPGKFCPGLISVDEQQQQQQQWQFHPEALSQQQHRKLDRSLSEPVGDYRPPKGPNINSSRYKTELCRPFEENGKCKYGDKCQFAHGALELRIVARHPKYKTELCRTYHTSGLCPYGMRCNFIHNEDERKLMQYIQQKQQLAVKEAAEQIVESLKLQEMPSVRHSISRPAPIQRPKQLPYAAIREALGSTADSPPDSMSSESPQSLSPISYADHEVFLPSSSFGSTSMTPPPSGSSNSSGISFTGTFQFMPAAADTSSDSCSPTPVTKPLNVRTDAITCLPAGLQAVLRVPYESSTPYPPSPPDSLNGDSEVDSLTRNMRLPFFSRLSDD